MAQAELEIRPTCGSCQLAVNDLDPICCGLCEKTFHTTCLGFSRSSKDIIVQGKAIFVCEVCRVNLNGKSLRVYFSSDSACQGQCPVPAPRSDTDGISSQMQKLSEVVEALGNKVDSLVDSATSGFPLLPVPASEGADDGFTFRRRPTPVVRRPVSTGTKSIDLSGISISTIVAQQPKPRFYLYLAGFDPRITTNDVGVVVSRCLGLSEPPTDIVRLVAKGTELSTLSYVSFKIGLDLELKQLALDDVWPNDVKFREFVQVPKNLPQPLQRSSVVWKQAGGGTTAAAQPPTSTE